MHRVIKLGDDLEPNMKTFGFRLHHTDIGLGAHSSRVLYSEFVAASAALCSVVATSDTLYLTLFYACYYLIDM